MCVPKKNGAGRNTNILLGMFRTLHQELVLQRNVPEKVPVDSPVVDRPNQAAYYLIDGIRDGFRIIDTDKSPPSIDRRNYPSAAVKKFNPL